MTLVNVSNKQVTQQTTQDLDRDGGFLRDAAGSVRAGAMLELGAMETLNDALTVPFTRSKVNINGFPVALRGIFSSSPEIVPDPYNPADASVAARSSNGKCVSFSSLREQAVAGDYQEGPVAPQAFSTALNVSFRKSPDSAFITVACRAERASLAA